MRAAFIVLGLCCAAASARAGTPPASLFFDAESAGKIEALAEKNRLPHANAAAIHLGAVFYYGPKDWALWLQGHKWTPDTDQPDLHIVDVSPGEVQMLWQGASGAAPQEITLRPYQTFEITTGEIIEGAY